MTERLRAQLIAELHRARAATDALFALVTPEGLLQRPIAERHRLLFYVGHLEAFDWNLLCRDALGQPSLHATFERLFAFGIDPVDGQLPTDTPADWPSLSAIAAWRQQARQQVDAAIATAPFVNWLEGGWAAHMAIEHRLMHVETLWYLLRRLPLHLKRPGPAPIVAGASVPSARIRVPAGVAELGLQRELQPFLGWDNEYGLQRFEVPEFEVDQSPVSNIDWLAFIDAGGYHNKKLWAEPDWAWREKENVTHPAFWQHVDGRWHWQAMFAQVPLPLSWPVYVSLAEASAYARWRKKRLLTEAQWHRAAEGANPVDSRLDPSPPGGAQGPHHLIDLVGNGWEWTSTVFAPLPGFTPLPFYPGYSANFFDGLHFVLKGASPATDRAMIRTSFRNFFQPHYQHVFAKFRLAGDTQGGTP